MCLIAIVKSTVAGLRCGRCDFGRNTASNKQDAATGGDFEHACISAAIDAIAKRELCRSAIKRGHPNLVSRGGDPLGKDVNLVPCRQQTGGVAVPQDDTPRSRSEAHGRARFRFHCQPLWIVEAGDPESPLSGDGNRREQ